MSKYNIFFILPVILISSVCIADDITLTLIRNKGEEATEFAKPDWKINETFKDVETIGNSHTDAISNIHEALSKTQTILASHTWSVNDLNTPILFKTYQDHSVIYGSINLSKGRFYQSEIKLVEIDHDHYYALTQSRRISNGQINYFDHPRFGLFLQVHQTNQADNHAKLPQSTTKNH